MSYSYEGLSIKKNEIILVIFKCSILVSLNYWLGLILKSLLKSLGKNAYNADMFIHKKVYSARCKFFSFSQELLNVWLTFIMKCKALLLVILYQCVWKKGKFYWQVSCWEWVCLTPLSSSIIKVPLQLMRDEMKDDEAMHFQEISSIFTHFPTFFELMSQKTPLQHHLMILCS